MAQASDHKRLFAGGPVGTLYLICAPCSHYTKGSYMQHLVLVFPRNVLDFPRAHTNGGVQQRTLLRRVLRRVLRRCLAMACNGKKGSEKGFLEGVLSRGFREGIYRRQKYAFSWRGVVVMIFRTTTACLDCLHSQISTRTPPSQELLNPLSVYLCKPNSRFTT